MSEKIIYKKVQVKVFRFLVLSEHQCNSKIDTLLSNTASKKEMQQILTFEKSKRLNNKIFEDSFVANKLIN